MQLTHDVNNDFLFSVTVQIRRVAEVSGALGVVLLDQRSLNRFG